MASASAMPQWPRTCDSPNCHELVHEWGRLRHKNCPPPRYITCPDCQHLFDGLAMLVDHYRPAAGMGRQTTCELVRGLPPMMHDRPPAVIDA